MHTLKNDILTVEVSSHGAELTSIRKGSTEYLWQADPAFWGRHSPVLFPIVGSVWEGEYRVDGQTYRLGQHGFARDMEFTLVSSSETEIRFRLDSDMETLKKYPWPFRLEIAYRLHDNKLDVIWEVTNPGDGIMYFQIGAHPAFNYPDYDKDRKERGFFSFDRKGSLRCIRLAEKGCVDPDSFYDLELDEYGRYPLFKDTFDIVDTFFVQDSQLKKVTLHSPDGKPWLNLTFDAPVVGLWSPPGKNAPFVCIEPWYGRCDRACYDGDYKDKDWINSLMGGEVFSAAYTIEIE